MMKAVIDRIIENKAVLLVGEREVEYVIEAGLLPEGAKEGDWMQVKLDENEMIVITIDDKETETVKKRIKGKLANLKQKSSSSKFRNT